MIQVKRKLHNSILWIILSGWYLAFIWYVLTISSVPTRLHLILYLIVGITIVFVWRNYRDQIRGESNRLGKLALDHLSVIVFGYMTFSFLKGMSLDHRLASIILCVFFLVSYTLLVIFRNSIQERYYGLLGLRRPFQIMAMIFLVVALFLSLKIGIPVPT